MRGSYISKTFKLLCVCTLQEKLCSKNTNLKAKRNDLQFLSMTFCSSFHIDTTLICLSEVR